MHRRQFAASCAAAALGAAVAPSLGMSAGTEEASHPYSPDPKTSFFTPDNHAHDVKNLSVSDGACMTSSSYVNPLPTSMALTARACHYGIPKVNKGEL